MRVRYPGAVFQRSALIRQRHCAWIRAPFSSQESREAFFDDEDRQAGEAVRSAIKSLAVAQSLRDRLAATKSLRLALAEGAAAAELRRKREAGTEEGGGGSQLQGQESALPLNVESPEQIYVYFSSRKLRLSDVHSYLMASPVSVDGKGGAPGVGDGQNDEDEKDEDEHEEGYELAADSPIAPQSLTFGTTPFDTVAACLDLLRDRYAFEANEFDELVFGSGGGSREMTAVMAAREKTKTWLDLGSGDGGPTVAAALLHPWKTCWGVEVRRSLQRHAEAVASEYDAWLHSAVDDLDDVDRDSSNSQPGSTGVDSVPLVAAPGSNMDRSAAADRLVFDHADVRRLHLKKDGRLEKDEEDTSALPTIPTTTRSAGEKGSLSASIKDVDVLFSHATCFDDGLMAEIGSHIAPRLKPGCFVLTASKPIPSPFLQTLETRTVPYSWGMGTVVVQQRLPDEEVVTGVSSGNESVSAPATSSDSSVRGHRLLRGLGGNRMPLDYTPALNEIAAPMFRSDSENRQGAALTGLALLVHQVRDGLAVANHQQKDGGDNIQSDAMPSDEDQHIGCMLAIEAAVALSTAAAVEMNARALVAAPLPATTGRRLNGCSLRAELLSRGGLVSMINVGRGDLLELQGREAPSVVHAVRASGCLAVSALASHYGSAAAVVESGVANALVDLLMPSLSTEDTATSGSSESPPQVEFPPAILGAAAACVARCSEVPTFAAEMQVRGVDARLSQLVDGEMAQNPSFRESAGAAIAAINRFAPVAAAMQSHVK